MNAFNVVNLSAACILTSTEFAEKLGIPKDRWTYVLGGAGTHEKDACESPRRRQIARKLMKYLVWERPHFHSSHAISQSLDSALEVSGLTKSDIDCFDFYSSVLSVCFPRRTY
jgi:hypothetical protein